MDFSVFLAALAAATALIGAPFVIKDLFKKDNPAKPKKKRREAIHLVIHDPTIGELDRLQKRTESKDRAQLISRAVMLMQFLVDEEDAGRQPINAESLERFCSETPAKEQS